MIRVTDHTRNDLKCVEGGKTEIKAKTKTFDKGSFVIKK